MYVEVVLRYDMVPVVHPSAPFNEIFCLVTDLWPLAGKPCPMDLVYCLNGGTCTYYQTIGEFTCQ